MQEREMRFKMENQGKLIEMLQEMKEIAHSQNNYLTKNEIANYLGDTVLSKEQLQAVYHYLGENHIEVEGYVYIPDRIDQNYIISYISHIFVLQFLPDFHLFIKCTLYFLLLQELFFILRMMVKNFCILEQNGMVLIISF